MCGALDNYKDNSTAQDMIWGIVYKYFFECHQNQVLISSKVAINMVLIEINQLIKARPNNPTSKYLRNLISNIN